jgi:predicted kinase
MESSDRVRKELAGIPWNVHDFSGHGKGIYNPELTDKTYAELLSRADKALSAGKGVIIDATCQKKRDRDAFRSLAERFSAQFFIIVTVTPEEQIHDRLDARLTNPLEVSDGRRELFQRQQEEFELPAEDETCQILADTALPAALTVDSIYKGIKIYE